MSYIYVSFVKTPVPVARPRKFRFVGSEKRAIRNVISLRLAPMVRSGEEIHVSTLLYLVAGWLLLNVLFAVGMYFRPRRKGATESQARLAQTENPLGEGNLPGRAGIRQPFLVRLLLFGVWLGDNRHSA